MNRALVQLFDLQSIFIALAVPFGLWQNNLHAGIFAFVAANAGYFIYLRPPIVIIAQSSEELPKASKDPQ